MDWCRAPLTNYNEEGTVMISTHLISDIEKVLDEAIFLKDLHRKDDGDDKHGNHDGHKDEHGNCRHGLPGGAGAVQAGQGELLFR